MVKHNGRIIANARYCDTMISRARGLMFALPWKSAVLVATKESIPKTSIHMFFVFYPLDIIWLDMHKQVIEVRRKVYPFTPNVTPRRGAKYIVEVPAGVAEGILQGQRLEFIPQK